MRRTARRAALAFVVLSLVAMAPLAATTAHGQTAASSFAQAGGLDQTSDRALRELLRRAGLGLSPGAVEDPSRSERVLLRLGDADSRVVDRRPGRGPATKLRTSDIGPDQLLVVTVDATGQALSAAVVADPRTVRVEWPGRAGLLSGRTVQRSSVDVVVDLPADPEASGVRVYDVTMRGSLSLIDEAPLPDSASSGPLDSATTASVTSLVHNGPSENRVDVVVVGDGYTAAQLPTFALDTGEMVTDLFAQQPFTEYGDYFNVRRVDVASSESGADHPSAVPSVHVDTAFDSTYDCGGIQRLICADTTLVQQAISGLAPTERDIVVLIVNDAAYGGSGGSISVASTHPDSSEIVLHELGHSFGLLADEYGGGTGPSCSTAEPQAVNATTNLDRSTLKWRPWVDAATALPTTNVASGTPGAYDGAAYCDSGLYRPTYNSKMRSLGQPFEQVNTEQLVRRTYAFVRPVDAVSPSTGVLERRPGQIQAFRVEVPTPATHDLTATWTVDGVAVGSGLELALSYDALSAGEHLVAVTVSDPTPLVREDAAGVLRLSHSWTVLPALVQVSTPTVRQDCFEDRWRKLVDREGRLFRTQGQCVAWVVRPRR